MSWSADVPSARVGARMSRPHVVGARTSRPHVWERGHLVRQKIIHIPTGGRDARAPRIRVTFNQFGEQTL